MKFVLLIQKEEYDMYVRGRNFNWNSCVFMERRTGVQDVKRECEI
jgi:hypothetical protein